MDKRYLFGLGGAGVASVLILALVLGEGLIHGGEEKIVIIDFDCEKAAEHVRQLCSNGPRMSGSPEEYQGALYIESQFKDAGLSDVHMESFPVPMFKVHSASMELVEYYPMGNLPRPMGDHIRIEHITEFVLQGYSGSLQWRDFRDDMSVVNVGDGTDPGSFSRARGAACLIEQTSDTPPNSEIYFQAYEQGALAIILQNCFRGESIGYLPMFKTNQNPIEYEEYPDIPFMMVSKAAGDLILERTSGNYRLRMDIDVEIGNFDIHVVVGDIPARGGSEDMMVFTAHHDTCYNTMGAIDNTVGPATLIEMAREMAKDKYSYGRTIRFCTVGGEEEGLYGSTWYYDSHREELEKRVRMVMNFDMAHADRDSMSVGMVSNCNDTISDLEDIRGALLSSDPELKAYTINIGYDPLDIKYSDYWSFVNGGSAGVAAWGSGCEEYHTYLDDLEHLNAESLQVEARILGTYALMASG